MAANALVDSFLSQSKQVLQQEAYPAIWPPADAQNSPTAITLKMGENPSEIAT